VCCETDIAALAVGEEAERVPPTKAVAGNGNLLDLESLAHVLDGGGDDGVGHLGAVVVEELLEVKVGRAIDVLGRGLALEQVGRDGQEAGAAEAVGEPV